jgi:DNA-binding NarL/FixJ family response regulator
MLSQRLVLIDVPPLVRDLVRMLVIEQPTLELVGEYADADEALADLDDAPADVIVTTKPESEPVRELLRHWPRARVIVMSDDGRRTTTFELVLRERVLGDVSVDSLLRELQRAEQRDG